MKKHIVRSAIALAAVSAMALAGCSTAAPETGGDAQAPAEITFLTFQSPNLTEDFWNKQVAEIQKEYPNLKVTIQYTPDLDRQGYAKQLLATGNLPDVIWDVPLQDFVTAGALLPYDATDLANIDAPDTAGLVEGKHYSLTLGAQVIPMIYYNKDVFADLGIKVPTTYAELTAAAKKIKAAGLTPFLLGGGADTWASSLFLDGVITSDVLGANPEWVEQRKAGKVSFTDPEFASAVEKWNALYTAGDFNADALTIDYSQLSAKFAAGEGVMYPMGTWAGTTKADFNVGVFPLPSDSGDVVQGLNYGQALAVSATTKFPAQARAFAVALATGDGPNLAQLNSDSLIPVVKGFKIPSDTAPLILDTVGAYRTEGSTYVDPFGWTQGGRALPSGFSAEFDKGVQQLLSGSITVKDFLKNLDVAFDDLNKQG